MITRQQAWHALGAGPLYKPREPEQPATPGQLIAINLQNRLAIIGDPLEPGEDARLPNASAAAEAAA